MDDDLAFFLLAVIPGLIFILLLIKWVMDEPYNRMFEHFRNAALIQSLKLEQKGMRHSRYGSVLKIAKKVTGLKTNDRQKQIDALAQLIKIQLAQPGELR